jgi:hypothetical protein
MCAMPPTAFMPLIIQISDIEDETSPPSNLGQTIRTTNCINQLITAKMPMSTSSQCPG